jgi:hypothetical protein
MLASAGCIPACEKSAALLSSTRAAEQALERDYVHGGVQQFSPEARPASAAAFALLALAN